MYQAYGGFPPRRPGPARLVIVDDSVTMRALIRRSVERDNRFAVVGEANHPIEARRMLAALNPDLLTLDIQMPHMDGLTFLDQIMRQRPLPVVMISAETPDGSDAALEALSRGAVDCIGKSELSGQSSLAHFADRLAAAAKAKRQCSRAGQRPPVPVGDYYWNGRYVLIGASTGGVEALERILSQIPANGPPTVICQHMPAPFLARFSARLDAHIAPKVQVASDRMPILPGNVYLAPGGVHNLLIEGVVQPVCRLVRSTDACPSVDVMFGSARPIARRVLAVLLTGMGQDGAAQMLRLRQSGAYCMTQDEDSSVIYGMPKAALKLGAADEAVHLSQVARRILTITGRSVM
ncbi:MAG: chemotaxis-specific protein-glutamate methyltransferase CheB [Albidovulum sp.]